MHPWHAWYPKGLSPHGAYPDFALWGFLERAAQAHPAKDALSTAAGEERFDYAALWRASASVAARLTPRLRMTLSHAKPPVERDSRNPDEWPDRVLLWLPNVPAFVHAYYGALRAGAIVTAASPALSMDELTAQLMDAAPRVIVTDSVREGEVRDAIFRAELTDTTLLTDADIDALAVEHTHFAPPNLPQRFNNAAEVAVLQYTSGTTGAAKAAMMSHRNLVANALQNARWFGWDEHVITLAVLPLCHTWGMSCCLNSTMAVGGTLVLMDQSAGFDPRGVFDAVERHNATVLYGSATMFHRLLEAAAGDVEGARRKLATLRHAKAGAMLSQGSLKSRWDAFCANAPLQQGYGLTEASPESHNNPPERFKLGTVGIPIQDTECRVVMPDDPARDAAPGEAGEVLLHGPQITLGYWRKPEASEHAFARHWLRTGDLGVLDDEGYLTIVDRLKDLLKYRGFSISPNNIEECLLRHPDVAEAIVVGRLDEKEGEIPTAFIVLKPGVLRGDSGGHGTGWRHGTPDGGQTGNTDGHAPVIKRLTQHCRLHLAHYEVPKEFRIVGAIPKNHVGKPLRRVLRAELNAGA